MEKTDKYLHILNTRWYFLRLPFSSGLAAQSLVWEQNTSREVIAEGPSTQSVGSFKKTSVSSEVQLSWYNDILQYLAFLLFALFFFFNFYCRECRYNIRNFPVSLIELLKESGMRLGTMLVLPDFFLPLWLDHSCLSFPNVVKMHSLFF